jgi:hypothetical protein
MERGAGRDGTRRQGEPGSASPALMAGAREVGSRLKMARSVREEGGNGDSSSPPGGRAGFRWKRRPAVVHRGPNPRPHGYGSMTRGPRRCRVLGSNPLDPGASGSGRNPAAAMSVLGAAGAVGGGSGPATDGALALRTWRVADRRVAVRGRRACAADLLVDLAPLHACTGIGVRAYALGRVCCRRTVRRWLAAAGIHRSSTIFVQHVKEKTAKEQPDWIDDAQWISILMVYSHRCALNIQRPITVYKNIYKLLKILCSIWCITSHETHHIQLY